MNLAKEIYLDFKEVHYLLFWLDIPYSMDILTL